MQYKDYYALMGVERNATPEEIKRSYRKLARKYHPDVNKAPDAEERMKEVNEAYEVLSDKQKRAQYDQLGSQWQGGQEFTPPPGSESQFYTQFSDADVGQFSDFFEALFGGGGAHFRQTHRPARHYAMRGEDLHFKIRITLEEAFAGATREFRIPINETYKTLKVKIPAGITEGKQIRLTGQGGAGSGNGENGDVYLEVEFEKNPLFHADNTDIYLTLPVAPWEAALGATVATPTLSGNVDLKIPPNSQSGQKLRLRGRGLPAKTPGDQYVTLQVILPKAETEAARDVYQKMAETLAFNPRAHMGIKS